MRDTRSFFKIEIALFVMVLMAAMVGNGVGGPRKIDGDEWNARSQGQETRQTLAVPEADHPSPQLAMNSTGDGDSQELQELLAVLDEETVVATKTKMNNDYVPGMVTVLHREQLEALGLRNVAEALSMVPGIQVSRLSTGEPTLKVRGIAFPFNAGNVKVMLNSIALSRESSGINSSVLLTPIAQVDRIEVIRGPGSSLYGDFAMAGVVNIITRSSGGHLFVGAGDDESRSGGGYYNYRDEAHAFDIGVNLSVVDDGKNAGGAVRNPEEERYAGIFKLNYKKFSLTAEGVRRNAEFQRMPMIGAPPPSPDGPTPRSYRNEESWAVEGKQTVELPRHITMEAYLSYLKNSYDTDEPMTRFHGDRVETGLNLGWEPHSAHQLLLSASYTNSQIDDAYQEKPQGVEAYQTSDLDRRNYSFSFQDQISVTDRFAVTLGARFDDYDDVGSRWTPRLAAVYQLAEHHVVKAQYSQGFRAPTFWELYGSGDLNESLDFEVISTTELSYIFRRPDAVGRVTFYYSEINDGIFISTPSGFDNNVEIDSKGAEVEWEQKLGEIVRWQANLSFNDTWDGRYDTIDHRSPGVASWLGNLAIFVQPASRLLLTGRLLHVGDRYTSDGQVSGYDTVDLTASVMDLLIQGVTLRFGVKNVFDDEIVYMTIQPNALLYSEFPGRTWWVQVSYNF